MPAAPDGTSLWRFAGPRYWSTWFGLGLIRVLDWLPFRVQMFLGGVLGSLAFAFARRERHVAALNIEMCLPERGERERHQLMRAHFASLGKSLFETALVWWAEDQRLKRIIRIDGVEHLSTALAEGKGAILLSAHFTTLEMGARALCIHHASVPAGTVPARGQSRGLNPGQSSSAYARQVEVWRPQPSVGRDRRPLRRDVAQGALSRRLEGH